MKTSCIFSAITLLCLLAAPVACMAGDGEIKTGEKRDTLLYVRTTPPGAKVLLNGKELGRSNDLFPVEPGVAKIVVELPGHKTIEQEVTIRASGVTRLELALKPTAGDGNAANAAAAPASKEALEATAKQFLTALRDNKLDGMKDLSLGAVQGWIEKYPAQTLPVRLPGLIASSLEQMLKELHDKVYVDNMERLTEIQEVIVQDDLGAVRISSPQGKHDAHYIFLIFKQTPKGWRFVTGDDARSPLREELPQQAKLLTMAFSAMSPEKARNIPAIRENLAVGNNDAVAHNALGAQLLEQGRTDEAIRQFQQALQVRPDFAEAHYNLGKALIALKQIDEAISHYRKALQLKPDYLEARDALNAAGAAHDKAGQPTTVPSSDDKSKVVEGLGWGDFRLGATREELVKAFGPPDPSASGAWVSWKSKYHVDCLFNPAGHASEIRFNEGFTLPLTSGVKIGSSERDVLLAYGAPDRVVNKPQSKMLDYSKRGVLMWIADGKVFDFTTFQPHGSQLPGAGPGNGPSSAMASQGNSENFVATQLRGANAGNYWAKYRLWAAYHKGTDGVQKNPEEAKKWLAELVKGAYLATFRPVKPFAPRTPQAFLANFNEHSTLRSEPNSLGGASFFRTTAKGGVLIGSFLTAYPDKMREVIAANPSLELISIEELTPDVFVRYEASSQESLDANERQPPSDTLESPAGPEATNHILTNPGIENGNDMPEGWQQGAPIDGVKYSWDKNIGFKSKASLCIEKTENRYFPIAQWSQTVDRTGDSKVLEVSARVKAQKMTKATVDVIFLDKDDQWISHKWAAYIGAKSLKQPPANHDWKKYSGKVGIPARTAKICVALQVYGPGTVWFDDIEARYGK